MELVMSEGLPYQPTPVTSPSRPEVLPMPPRDENIETIQEWFLQWFSYTMFNANRYTLPVMERELYHIHLKEDVVPYACHTPADIRQALGG